MTVDVERLTSAWLRNRTELDPMLSDRIYTTLPADKTFPAMRLTLIDDEAITERPLWVTKSQLQFDVWGGPKAQARAIADTTRYLLDRFYIGTQSIGDVDGVISGVGFGSYGYDVDPDFQPERPRYRFVVFITAHPVPTSSVS